MSIENRKNVQEDYNFDLLKKTKRIAISIRNEDVFVNGNVQNSYFLLVALKKIGYEVDFVTEDEKYNKFEPFGLEVKYIDPKTFPFSEYFLIIYGSWAVGGLERIVQFKKNNTRIVYFNCGNYYVFHQEEFLFGKVRQQSQFQMLKSITQFTDEIWTIPSYEFMNMYMETITLRKVFLLPHFWSPEIIERRVINDVDKGDIKDINHFKLYYNPDIKCIPKVTLFIMEPNINISKSCWLPLIIAERLNQVAGSMLDKVHCFCVRLNEFNNMMMSELSLHKDGKIQFYQRQPAHKIFNTMHNHKTLPILLSHQTWNSLNYIYYEALHFGYPLIHNSTMIKDYGYYYPENDVDAAIKQIVDAHHNFLYDFTEMKKKNKAYLEDKTNYSEKNLDRVNDMVRGVLSKRMIVNIEIKENPDSNSDSNPDSKSEEKVEEKVEENPDSNLDSKNEEKSELIDVKSVEITKKTDNETEEPVESESVESESVESKPVELESVELEPNMEKSVESISENVEKVIDNNFNIEFED